MPVPGPRSGTATYWGLRPNGTTFTNRKFLFCSHRNFRGFFLNRKRPSSWKFRFITNFALWINSQTDLLNLYFTANMYIAVMLTILQGFTTPSTQSWLCIYVLSWPQTALFLHWISSAGELHKVSKLKRHFKFIISFYLIKNQLPLQLHKEE